MVCERTPPPMQAGGTFTSYEYILNQGVEPENIIVIGDSAGGNLALELAVYLKEHNTPRESFFLYFYA